MIATMDGAPLTVRDLADDPGWRERYQGFRLPGGEVEWEQAERVVGAVVVSRTPVEPTKRRPVRFVSPLTRVVLVAPRR